MMQYSKDELYERRKNVIDTIERLAEEKNKILNRFDEIEECLRRDVDLFERILSDDNCNKRTADIIEKLLEKNINHIKKNEDNLEEILSECDKQNRELEEELYTLDYEIENGNSVEEN